MHALHCFEAHKKCLFKKLITIIIRNKNLKKKIPEAIVIPNLAHLLEPQRALPQRMVESQAIHILLLGSEATT